MRSRNTAAGILVGLAIAELAVAATPSKRIPIEVEVQPGAVSCTPGDGRFDAGFRAGLREELLVLADSTRASRVVVNAFCLGSERPDVKPLHILVRIRCDAGMNYDYVGPASGTIRTADHWLIQVGVPLGGHRLAPARWHRVSVWARSDRASYCENIGHAIALCVLEAVSHETGHLKRGELLALGPDVNRDARYSEGRESVWKVFVDELPRVGPVVALWVIVLGVAFAVLRLTQIRRRHLGSTRGAPPARSV